MPPDPDSQSSLKVWEPQPRTIGFLYNTMSRASPKAFPTPFSHTSAKDSQNDMTRMAIMVNTLGYETISQAIMMMNIDPRLRFRKAFSLSRFKVGDTGRHRFEFFNDPGSADELASTMIFLGYFKDSNEAVDFIDDQTGQSMRLAAPLGRARQAAGPIRHSRPQLRIRPHQLVHGHGH